MKNHPLKTTLALGLLALLASGCSLVSWTIGSTHGYGSEPERGQVNVLIYRKARKALYDYMYTHGVGVKGAADVIWANAKGPLSGMPYVCVSGVCIGGNQVSDIAYNAIYGRLGDLQSAIIDANNNSNCLAFTVLSWFVPTENWTNKSNQLGEPCIIGGLK